MKQHKVLGVWSFTLALLIALLAATFPISVNKVEAASSSDKRVNQYSPYLENNQYEPDLDIDYSCAARIVWTSIATDGDSGGIYARNYGTSGSFGPPGPIYQVNTYWQGNEHEPKIAVSYWLDYYVVTWTSDTQDPGANKGVYAKIYKGDDVDPSNLDIGNEFRVNPTTLNNQYESDVSMDVNGNFVVVWTDDGGLDGAGKGVFMRGFDKNGSELFGETQVNTNWMGDQYEPTVSMMYNGNFVVAWTSDDASGEGIYFQSFNSTGGPQGVETQANTYTTDDQHDPDVDIGPLTGFFVITWTSDTQDAGTAGVYAQRFQFPGTWLGTEFQVNITTVNAQYQPAVGVYMGTTYRDFVIAWTSVTQDGFGNGVYKRIYDDNGVPVTGEIRVNGYTPNDQDSPAIEMDDSVIIITVFAGFEHLGGILDDIYLDLESTDDAKSKYDFGDAPDVPVCTYPSWFRSNGARHFDTSNEWLGPWVDIEPDSRQVDRDLFDDGVRIAGSLVPGGTLTITVDISTSGVPGRYNIADPDMVMYLNGWIDWNCDCDWKDPGDKVIGTGSPTGTQMFAGPARVVYTVPVPGDPCCPTWARFRLDYAEDVGLNPQSWTHLSLLQDEGQALYGEVEDYVLPCPPSGVPVFPNWYILALAVVAAGGLSYFMSRRLLKRA